MAVRFSMGLPTIESKPKKTRQGNSVNTILAASSRNKKKKKYKKPQTRGDKTYHKRQKRG